jgi:ABC-type dipeptide/oligopeptide/nickel transport system permease subunit
MSSSEVTSTELEPRDGALGNLRRSPLWATVRATGWPGLLFAFFLLAALVGPLFAPYDPLETHALQPNLPPFQGDFILGTDGVGRDSLSRILHGTQLSLMIGLTPVIIATIIGVILSLITAFGHPVIGFAIMRVADVFLAFPAILLALAVAAMLGPSMRNEILALVIVLIPAVLRIGRAAALEVASRPYVEAARMAGPSRLRLVRDVILPNMFAPVLVYAAALSGLVIIFGAGLSFLGVGVQPPEPEWGRMVADGRNDFLINPWPSLIPGACIFLVGLSLNLAADRLRDHLDPRLR